MMLERLRQRADEIKSELSTLEDEMDRCDSFDGFKLDLRKKAGDLRQELEQTEGLLIKFGPEQTLKAASM